MSTLKKKCAFTSCNNFNETMVGLSFYKFPVKNKEICEKWVKITGTEELQRQGKLHLLKVCSRHFKQNHFIKSKKQTPIRKKLKKDALPIEKIQNDTDGNDANITKDKATNDSEKYEITKEDKPVEVDEEESSTEEMDEEDEELIKNTELVKKPVMYWSSSEEDEDYSSDSLMLVDKPPPKKKLKPDDNANFKTVEAKELVKVTFKGVMEYLRTNSLPEYWAWYYLDETIIFALVHKLLFRVKLKIIVNSDLFVTICAPNRKATSTLKSITTISDLFDRLKYAEDLQVCMGLGIEGRSYSPNCTSFVANTSGQSQQKLPPRCGSCSILRKSYLF